MDGATTIVQKTDDVLVVDGDHFQDLTALVHLMIEHLHSQRLAVVESLFSLGLQFTYFWFHHLELGLY